jgi:hypothetical protein
VQSVSGNVATVIDTTTQTRQVSITNMPAKGVPPAPGEQWLIHRQYGAWTFGLCLNTPTALQEADITGLVDDLAALNTRTHLLDILLGGARVGYTQLAAPTNASPSGTGYITTLSGTSPMGIVFIAPPSGITTVDFGMDITTNTTTGATIDVSIAVSTGDVIGSGGATLTASDNNCFTTNSNVTVPGTRSVPVTGLTPGDEYNAFFKWRNEVSGALLAGSHAWMKTTPELA